MQIGETQLEPVWLAVKAGAALEGGLIEDLVGRDGGAPSEVHVRGQPLEGGLPTLIELHSDTGFLRHMHIEVAEVKAVALNIEFASADEAVDHRQLALAEQIQPDRSVINCRPSKVAVPAGIGLPGLWPGLVSKH